MLGAFLLAAAERLRSESEPAQGLSLAVIALAAAGHAALVFAHAAYAETAWTLFALTAAASYFALARKERSVRTAYLTLVPLVVGFTLFAVWKRLMVSGAHTGAFDPRTVLSDILIANPLWMVGAGVAAGLYLMAAHRLQRREFSAMGGAVAIAGYSHSLIFLFNPPADWFPFLVLPFVGLLYLAGILCADRAPTVGDPLRQTALAAAGLAALFVTVRTLASLTPVSPGSMLPTASAVATVFALMTFETYRTAARWPRVATLALVGMVAACCWHHRVPGTPFPASLWCGFALVASASYFLIASNEKRADLSQLALWPLLLGYGLFAVWRVQGGLGALDEAIANGLVALGGAVAAAAYFRAARTGRDPVFTYLAAGFAVCTWAHLIGLRPGWAPDWYLLALAPAPLALFLCGALAFSGHDYLRAPMRAVGLIVVGGSALFVTGRVTAGLGVTGADSLVPGGLLTACAFALAAAETYITSAAAPRVGSFAALALAGLVFQAHTHSGVPWIASLWAILIFGACAAYYVIARREESPLHGYAPLWSLLIGYPLFVSWKAHMVLAQPDRMMANLIWAAGVGALAFGYADTARRRKMQSFAYLGALLLIASYTHLLTILDPHERHVERYALLVLPLLAGMYAYGVMRQTDEYAGRPFRRVAIGLSAAAILTSTLYGDHLLPTLTGVTDHTLITLTLSAYGAAYLAIALFRRTTGTIAAASSTQTLAYLHGLLSATPFWAGASARLNWAEFAALTAVAGAAWTALAWLFTRRLPDTGYARPLQAIAALLALLAAFTAWSPGGLAAADAGAGLWSLTALALCGAIWLALWGEEVGEPCWHIGAWNLLAAWALVIRLYLPADATHFDMNAAPLALYLLIAGHRVSQRGGEQLARGLWWIGLSLLMAPAYILFWGRAAGGHHVPLLIAECVLASLWGIVRRIRAYVSAGFGFIVLLTVSSWVRSINDAAGTVAALVIGVALFVFVYYWLTHRQRIENWLLRVSGAWRAWTAWR